MGKNATLKQLRGQMRQIVKEIMPEVLTQEWSVTLRQDLSTQLNKRLDIIDKKVLDSLSYLIRQSQPATAVPSVIEKKDGINDK